MNTKNIVKLGLFLGLFFVASNIIPPVNIFGIPLTAQTLIILLIPFFFSLNEIIIWFVALLTICLIGMPIMSGFSGGLGVLVGPTAGFIYGWLPMMLVIKVTLRYNRGTLLTFVMLVVATIIDLILGGFWLTLLNGTDLLINVQMILIGFLPAGIIKVVLVQLVVKKIPSYYLDNIKAKVIAYE